MQLRMELHHAPTDDFAEKTAAIVAEVIDEKQPTECRAASK